MHNRTQPSSCHVTSCHAMPGVVAYLSAILLNPQKARWQRTGKKDTHKTNGDRGPWRGLAGKRSFLCKIGCVVLRSDDIKVANSTGEHCETKSKEVNKSPKKKRVQNNIEPSLRTLDYFPPPQCVPEGSPFWLAYSFSPKENNAIRGPERNNYCVVWGETGTKSRELATIQTRLQV